MRTFSALGTWAAVAMQDGRRRRNRTSGGQKPQILPAEIILSGAIMVGVLLKRRRIELLRRSCFPVISNRRKRRDKQGATAIPKNQ
jgi:hypothetical protein